MSEEVTQNEEGFLPEEIQQFDIDDGQCGRAIGKMLALFFLYTVVAMSIAALWTYGVG